MRTVARAVVLLALFAVVAPARADEEKVPLKDLPKAVADAVKARFPDAKLKEATKETEAGKTTYEVALKDKGKNVDVALTAVGKIVEVEREVAAADLPRAVASAIELKYPKATIKKAEEVVAYEAQKETKSYEVVLATAAKKTLEVTLSPEGKVLEEE